VKLVIASETFEGKARFLADRAQHERAQLKMRRKYWMYWPIVAATRVLMAAGLLEERTGSFEVTLDG
jgi:hypothetical protein